MNNATLYISGNLVQYNSFVGPSSAFFYINGGIIRILDNNFSYNGFLTLDSFASNPVLDNEFSIFPYEMFAIDID